MPTVPPAVHHFLATYSLQLPNVSFHPGVSAHLAPADVAAVGLAVCPCSVGVDVPELAAGALVGAHVSPAFVGACVTAAVGAHVCPVRVGVRVAAVAGVDDGAGGGGHALHDFLQYALSGCPFLCSGPTTSPDGTNAQWPGLFIRIVHMRVKRSSLHTGSGVG